MRGSIHVERKQVDDAIKAFHEAIAIDPKSYDAHLMLGSAQLLRRQHAVAVQTFSRAIKLEPEKGGGYGGRAMAYLSQGQRKAALDDLNHAIRFDPMRADLFRDRGQVYAMETHWSQALADLDTAIRVDPNDVEAHVSRAWVLATCSEPKLRDGAKAVESATRACELTRWKSPRPLATLAAAFAEKGDLRRRGADAAQGDRGHARAGPGPRLLRRLPGTLSLQEALAPGRCARGDGAEAVPPGREGQPEEPRGGQRLQRDPRELIDHSDSTSRTPPSAWSSPSRLKAVDADAGP